MFDNVHQFYREAEKFGKVLDAFIQNYGLTNSVIADHICYKCSSSDVFENIRRIFENDSKWIYQTIISGRRIAIIRTKQSLKTSVGNISLVELSDQKPNGNQSDGFDHIEIYPISKTYEELVSDLKSQGLDVNEIVRPHHTTHDIKREDGFIIRLTRESLAEKIKQEQM